MLPPLLVPSALCSCDIVWYCYGCCCYSCGLLLLSLLFSPVNYFGNCCCCCRCSALAVALAVALAAAAAAASAAAPPLLPRLLPAAAGAVAVVVAVADFAFAVVVLLQGTVAVAGCMLLKTCVKQVVKKLVPDSRFKALARPGI